MSTETPTRTDPSAPTDTLLRRAREAHQHGRLDDAEAGYRAVLDIDGDQPDALHWSGVLHFQRGRVEQADALMRRSIAILPTPLALANHASALLALGRRDDAARQLQSALVLNPAHLRARFMYADLLHEEGRDQEALDMYDALLPEAPSVAELWAKRAATLLALGDAPAALESSQRALQLEPRNIAALVMHGSAARATGQYDTALTSYARALTFVPGHTEILVARGTTLAEAGHTEQALASFNEAIATSPAHVGALHNSAVALERLGRYEDAVARCDRVLDIDSRHAGALANRGNALVQLGQEERAAESFARAVEAAPASLEALTNYARALHKLKRYPEAFDACARALSVDTAYAPAWFAKGVVHQHVHEHDAALESFDRALAGNPDDMAACFQRGNTLRTLKRHTEAIEAYDRVLARDPENIPAHFSKSFVYLALGDYARGWPEYEWRWKEDQVGGTKRSFPQPLWLGKESLEGKTILLHAEQGLGDSIQFVRYLERVKALGATIILEAPPQLKRLFQRMACVDVYVERGAPLPPFDYHCPLLSLALAFTTDATTIPAPVPYLSVDDRRLRDWRARLGPSKRRRVGLAWSGNPKHLDDHNRSVPFSSWLPVFDDEIEWFSLQKVVRDEDRPALEVSGIRHFGDELVDFDDTAALVEAMDHVISVDTSVAHLAGALGKPLWILLPYLPDWRWLLEGDTSAWYPGARLFRQPNPGDWQSVFDRLTREVRALRQ